MTHRARAFALLLLTAVVLSTAPRTGTAQGGMDHVVYLPLVARGDPYDFFGYGIQAHAWDAPQYTAGFVGDLGLGWLKQQVRWEYVEKTQGSYRWGETDRIADAAHDVGARVMYSVAAAPNWARDTDEGEGPPTDPQDFAHFMGVMAARYRGRVHAYEIWNEQNLEREWSGAPLNAADYVQLLSAVYGAIKAADPEAIVVSGALAPTGVNDGVVAVDDRVYLDQMYQAGLADACDAVGSHPYGFANPPEIYFTGGDLDPTRGWDEHPSFFFRNTLEDYYAVMVAHGDGGKRVWGTEFGWPTVDGMGVPPSPGYEYAADIDQGQQADYIVGAYAWAEEWGHAGVLFLWNLNFWPLAGAQNEMAKFSILKGDWSPRPAYIALRDMPK